MLTNIIFFYPERSNAEECYLNIVHSSGWKEKNIYLYIYLPYLILIYKHLSYVVSEGVSFVVDEFYST